MKADPAFLVTRETCKAHGPGEGDLCVLLAGHDGAHRFLDCRGCLYEMAIGGFVPFEGIAR